MTESVGIIWKLPDDPKEHSLPDNVQVMFSNGSGTATIVLESGPGKIVFVKSYYKMTDGGASQEVLID